VSSILEQVRLTAPDISCGHCVAAIQEEVGALSGVAAVGADIETKRVEVSFDPSRVSLAEIEAALTEAGYPVSK